METRTKNIASIRMETTVPLFTEMNIAFMQMKTIVPIFTEMQGLEI